MTAVRLHDEAGRFAGVALTYKPAASMAVHSCVSDVVLTDRRIGQLGLAPEEVRLRFGLHWGSRLYVGQITTAGRSEINALGDEVNETARIEACASGGRCLASKNLLERLEPDDAGALDLNPDEATYVLLGDLDTATDKARRDAPAVPVCSI